MKKIHHDINYYSIAQFLRKIIEIYLKDSFKQGVEKHEIVLKNVRSLWNMKKRRFVAEGKRHIRQLNIKTQPKPLNTVTYDDLFRPMIIQMH